MPQFDSLTTRMPNGLTNAAPYQTMGAAGIPDPSWAHVYHNDFDTFAAGDWTITKVGTGTTALTAGDGGQLLLTNTTGAADAIYMQLVAAGFKISGKKNSFFKFAGTLSAVTNDVFYAGLIMTSTTPLTANDSVFIRKPTGAATLELVSRVGGVETKVAFPSNLVPVAGTQFEVGISIDGQGNVAGYFNPTTGSDPSSIGVGRAVALLAPGLTTVNLAPSFGLLNSTGVANTLSVDYVTAVVER